MSVATGLPFDYFADLDETLLATYDDVLTQLTKEAPGGDR